MLGLRGIGVGWWIGGGMRSISRGALLWWRSWIGLSRKKRF